MGRRSSFSSDICGAAERTDLFTYQCVSCDTEFGLQKTRMLGVRCPDCQWMDVRDATER